MIDIGLITQITSAVVILFALGVSYGKLSAKVDRINGSVSQNRKDIASNTKDINQLKGRIGQPKREGT